MPNLGSNYLKIFLLLFLILIIIVVGFILSRTKSPVSTPQIPAPPSLEEKVKAQLPITGKDYGISHDPQRSKSIIVEIKAETKEGFFQKKEEVVKFLKEKFSLINNDFCQLDFRFIPVGKIALEIKDSEIFFPGCPLPDWVKK